MNTNAIARLHINVNDHNGTGVWGVSVNKWKTKGRRHHRRHSLSFYTHTNTRTYKLLKRTTKPNTFTGLHINHKNNSKTFWQWIAIERWCVKWMNFRSCVLCVCVLSLFNYEFESLVCVLCECVPNRRRPFMCHFFISMQNCLGKSFASQMFSFSLSLSLLPLVLPDLFPHHHLLYVCMMI